MLTVQRVRQEMDGILSQQYPPLERKQMQVRITFLTLCKTYLETNPTPEFVERQYDETIGRINRIKAMWTAPEKLSQKEATAWLNERYKESGMAKHKNHLKMLRELLRT